MILFVDDEERRVESYVDELRSSGLEVEYLSNADVAWDYLEANYANLDLVVLDIMMPAGQRFENLETESGLRTGIRLFEKIRRLAPNLPIAFLSNVSEDEAALRRDSSWHYFVKRRYLPYQFADEIKRILSESK